MPINLIFFIFLKFRDNFVQTYVMSVADNPVMNSILIKKDGQINLDSTIPNFYFVISTLGSVYISIYRDKPRQSSLVEKFQITNSSFIKVLLDGTYKVVVKTPDKANVIIAAGPIDSFDCDFIYISNSKSIKKIFAKEEELIWSLPIREKRCYFFVPYNEADHRVKTLMNGCFKCPEFDVYAGSSAKLNSITHDAEFDIRNTYYRSPTYIYIRPNGNTSIVDKLTLEFTASSKNYNFSSVEMIYHVNKVGLESISRKKSFTNADVISFLCPIIILSATIILSIKIYKSLSNVPSDEIDTRVLFSVDSDDIPYLD